MDRKYINEIIAAIVSGKSKFSELEFCLGHDAEDWNIVLKRLEDERDFWLVKKVSAELCKVRDDEADRKFERAERTLKQARVHIGKRVPNPDGDGDVIALPKEIYDRMLPNERVGYCVEEDYTKPEDVNTVQTDESSQPAKTKTPQKRGRTQKPFTDCFIDKSTASKYIERMEKYCKDRKGRDVALLLLIAIDKSIITKPTYSQVKQAFGDIGHRSGYSNYMNKGLGAYTSEEKVGVIRLLLES